MERIGLARPHRHARRVQRQRAGDALGLELVVDRREVADPHLVGIGARCRQHLHAGDDDAVGVLVDHLEARIVALLPRKEIAGADAGRRRHGKAQEKVVLARMVVIAQQPLARAWAQIFQHLGPHRESCHHARDMVGRTADEAVRRCGDRLQRRHAAAKIGARAAAQPIEAEALAIFLEEMLCLQIVEARDRRGAAAKGGMAGHVVDALGADIDRPSVAHALEFLGPGQEHCASVGTAAESILCCSAGEQGRRWR